MDFVIQFPDFSNTAAINKFIEKRLSLLQKRLESRFTNPTITLRGSVLNRKDDGKPKSFEAEIRVKIPRRKKLFVASQKNPNFRTALTGAVKKMESVIRRESKKAESGRFK